VRALSIYQLPAYYLTLLLFAAGGLELCLVSLLFAWLPDSDRVERFFQRWVHRHFALFHGWCAALNLVHVRYHGFDRLPRGGVILASNHISLIDITCLLARIPEAVTLFKPAIRRNPVLGAAARRAGYLGSDLGHEAVRAAAAKAAAGHLLVIFPEGTRRPPGTTLLPFKPGFVLIARRAGAPIQLVHIKTSSDVLTKEIAWWRLPRFPARIDVTLGPLLTPDAASPIAVVAAEIEAWFRSHPADNPACASTAAALSSDEPPAGPT
jgi:1-acyl-sn-glycerol-3-phosphate acyltransferase